MKGFIEVHSLKGKPHLINVNCIVEVVDNTVYTLDTPAFATEFMHLDCTENYDEIKGLIHDALKENKK